MVRNPTCCESCRLKCLEGSSFSPSIPAADGEMGNSRNPPSCLAKQQEMVGCARWANSSRWTPYSNISVILFIETPSDSGSRRRNECNIYVRWKHTNISPNLSQFIYISHIISFTIRFLGYLIASACVVLFVIVQVYNDFQPLSRSLVMGTAVHGLRIELVVVTIMIYVLYGKGRLPNIPVLNLPSQRLQGFIRRTLLVFENTLDLFVISRNYTTISWWCITKAAVIVNGG